MVCGVWFLEFLVGFCSGWRGLYGLCVALSVGWLSGFSGVVRLVFWLFEVCVFL